MNQLPKEKTVTAVSICVSSLYLTHIVDLHTLETALERIFVYFYFCIVSYALVSLRKKLLPSIEKKTFWIAFVISALLLVTCQNTFLPAQKEASVSLSASGQNEQAVSGQVWLTAITVNGMPLPLSQIEIIENQNWIYNSEFDDYIYYPPGDMHANQLLVDLGSEAKNVEFHFASNTWSGRVTVAPSSDTSETIDLYSNDPENSKLIYPLRVASAYHILQRVLYNVGAMVALMFGIASLAQFINQKSRHHSQGNACCPEETKEGSIAASWIENIPKHTIKKKTIVCYSVLLFALLFGSPVYISITLGSRIILFVLSVVCGLLCEAGYRSKIMERYFSVSGCIAIVGVSIYASFASFFYQFFLTKDRIFLSIQGITHVLLGILWWLPLVFSVLYLMELISAKIQDKKTTRSINSRKKAFICLTVALCACQAIGVLSFWPGGFANDSVFQMEQAVLGAPLNDWHPVFHTLCFRLIYSIIPEPGMIVVVQAGFFALLCTMVLMSGYNAGISLKKLVLIGGVFLLLPNQVTSSIGALKDFPYTLSLLWGTWLLFRLYQDSQICKTAWYSLSLILDLFFIACFRHNGIIPVILTVVHFKKIKCYLIVPALIASLSIAIFKGPIYDKMEVIPNKQSTYTPMMVAVGSCVNKGLPLSEEATDIMESVATLDVWRDYYNRFVGHDDYLWGRADGTSFDMTHITAKEAFRVYLEALIKYPDIVIKDRLDGMNIMWDISQPSESFNYRSFDAIYNVGFLPELFDIENMKQNIWGYYYNDSAIATLYRKTTNPSIDSLVDMVLWRSGLYLVLLLVMFVFWWKNRMSAMFWSAIPLIGNIAGYMLVLMHQSFRYVYAIQVLVIALFFFTICARRHIPAETTPQNTNNIHILE